MKLARKVTFNEITEGLKKASMQKLWNRAVIANQIAKLPQSRSSRNAAYGAKQKALEAVVDYGWAKVKHDYSSKQGLLSVELSKRRRLHALPEDAQRFAS